MATWGPVLDNALCGNGDLGYGGASRKGATQLLWACIAMRPQRYLAAPPPLPRGQMGSCTRDCRLKKRKKKNYTLFASMARKHGLFSTLVGANNGHIALIKSEKEIKGNGLELGLWSGLGLPLHWCILSHPLLSYALEIVGVLWCLPKGTG